MSKKTLIILIIIVVIVGIILGVFAFTTQRGGTPQELGLDVFSRFFQSDTRDVSTRDDLQTRDTQRAREDISAEIPLSPLRQLTKNPVSGAYIFERDGESVIRFIERESGHLFEIGENDTSVTRITNTTVPRVQRVVWIDEETVIFQYLNERGDTIESFFAVVSSEEEENTTGGELSLIGNFLPQNALSLTASENGQNVFYFLDKNIVGGFVADPDGTRNRQVFALPLTEWNVEWPRGSVVTLTTKASGISAGSLYFLNTVTENFEQVLGNIAGLTTRVRPDRKETLYSESTGNGFLFGIADINSGARRELPLQTLPEKCAWSEPSSSVIYCGIPVEIPSAVYPDTWYQGLVSFSDNLWSIDTADGATDLLVRLSGETRGSIDVVEPKLSPSENLLIFINKNDLTLWSFTLSEPEE